MKYVSTRCHGYGYISNTRNGCQFAVYIVIAFRLHMGIGKSEDTLKVQTNISIGQMRLQGEYWRQNKTPLLWS